MKYQEILNDAVEHFCADKENGKDEVIRVTSGTLRGKPYSDVRTYYLADGVELDFWKPTKGASIPKRFVPAIVLALLESIDFKLDDDQINILLEFGKDE